MQLLETIRADWKRFRAGTPGQRFQDFHDERARRRDGGWTPYRVFAVVGGAVLLLGGLAIGWLPGPGGFVSIFGAALLATEWRPLARALDTSEVLARRLWRWVLGWWEASPARSKALVVILLALFALGAGGIAWRITFG